MRNYFLNKLPGLNESDSETSVEQCPGRPATEVWALCGAYSTFIKMSLYPLLGGSRGRVWLGREAAGPHSRRLLNRLRDHTVCRWLHFGQVRREVDLRRLCPDQLHLGVTRPNSGQSPSHTTGLCQGSPRGLPGTHVSMCLLYGNKVAAGSGENKDDVDFHIRSVRNLRCLIILITTVHVSGGPIGIVVGTPMAGILVKEVSWESVFYIEAGMGLVWFAFFAFLCFNSPADHPRISKARVLHSMYNS